ncbi:MAG: phospho-N-acetylmuramoyl-pentapeptide-transferase [Candidatus Marinimicrobia bacterium CG08_land_8_20_14_0_20_45_22]|nr:MAG: phospho-N-acetylmuramoyl-pentapeptide-transferase [Candidatus Marinimicrobia bacterium CG08_land_8_20_14_0_20_45_22]
MFYHFLYPLKRIFSGFNLFQYITFRAAMAAITALLIAFIAGPFILLMLKKFQCGELIREDGPKTHLAKKGTPTMGGIIILISVIIPVLLWANLKNTYVDLILLATIWMGAIGFLDDYLKVVRKMKKGLIARYKLLGQISLGLIIGAYIYFSPEFASVNSLTTVPFIKDFEIDLGLFYIPIVIIFVTFISNAVNLTDGLDGLAAGLMGIAALTFAVIAYVSGRVDFSDYLNILYLPGSGELAIYATAFAGAILGFLWYNGHPAQVFMGDTGSLSMGCALGTMAILLKKEILFLLIGGVFIAEGLSVVIQVTYFRWTRKRTGTGKRIFLMAPLHHHFEMKGQDESKIVIRFWIIGILLAILGLSSFKIL